MSTDTTPLVELRDLQFGYNDRLILDGVSLCVPRGKVTALMGASGGGKTTVLRLIGGQVRAQSGQVLFDGQDVGSLKQEGLYALIQTRRFSSPVLPACQITKTRPSASAATELPPSST